MMHKGMRVAFPSEPSGDYGSFGNSEGWGFWRSSLLPAAGQSLITSSIRLFVMDPQATDHGRAGEARAGRPKQS